MDDNIVGYKSVCVYNAIVNEACTADGCSVMYGTYQRSGLVMTCTIDVWS